MAIAQECLAVVCRLHYGAPFTAVYPLQDRELLILYILHLQNALRSTCTTVFSKTSGYIFKNEHHRPRCTHSAVLFVHGHLLLPGTRYTTIDPEDLCNSRRTREPDELNSTTNK